MLHILCYLLGNLKVDALIMIGKFKLTIVYLDDWIYKVIRIAMIIWSVI